MYILKTCNSIAKFSKYVVMLNGVVAIDYKLVCRQTLSIIKYFY